MIWENGTETCIVSYKKQISSLGSMQGAGCLGLVHWDDPEGWCQGRWEGGSGLETHVHPWLIHINVWQNQYSIIKPVRPTRWRHLEKLDLKDWFILFYFTVLCWFCHTSTWIHHGCTCIPHPEPPSHLPPHTIPLGHPSAPAPSIIFHALNLDWRFLSYMILYMFQCLSPKSSHPHPLPQSPKDCSIHLCLFCSLAYRVTVLPSF